MHTFEAAGQTAVGGDGYGPPQARIGAISCRETSAAQATCGSDYIAVHITFINAPNVPPERALGLPGQRITFGLTAHRDASGTIKVDGIGITMVPPNSVLEPGGSPYSFGDIRRYLWTP